MWYLWQKESHKLYRPIRNETPLRPPLFFFFVPSKDSRLRRLSSSTDTPLSCDHAAFSYEKNWTLMWHMTWHDERYVWRHVWQKLVEIHIDKESGIGITYKRICPLPMGISINDVTHFTKYLGLWSNIAIWQIPLPAKWVTSFMDGL